MEGDGVKLSVPKRIESYLVEVVQIHAMCESSIPKFLTADLTLCNTIVDAGDAAEPEIGRLESVALENRYLATGEAG